MDETSPRPGAGAAARAPGWPHAHTLRTARVLGLPPALESPPVLGGRRTPRTAFPGRAAMRPLPAPGPAPQRAGPRTQLTNIYNNYRFVSRIVLQVHLSPTLLARQGGARDIGPFASALLDEALRRELDRQLALMRRGENLGENKRRRALFAGYLQTRGQEAVQQFAAAQLRPLPPPAPREEEFFEDIVHEKRTVKERTVEERRTVQLPPQRTESTYVPSPAQLEQLAEDVLSRFEKKLRTNSRRLGGL